MTAAIQDQKLLFLVGSQRSGTTWLHLLLAQSPSIAPLYETRLFSEYMRSCFQTWNQRASATKNMDGLHNVLGQHEYRDLLRAFAAGALAKGAAGRPSASIILEKSPDHAFFARDILSIFPDAYFLHIVRDPRAVVASLKAISPSWGIVWNAADACHTWLRHVAAAHTISTLTTNYREVRYEDLTAAGPCVLHGTFAWLGVSASPDDCARYYAACRIDSLRADKGLGERLHLEIAQSDFFRRGESDSWKTELSRREIALVEALAEPSMKQFGYQVTVPRQSRSAIVGMMLASVRFRQAAKWRLRYVADRL